MMVVCVHAFSCFGGAHRAFLHGQRLFQPAGRKKLLVPENLGRGAVGPYSPLMQHDSALAQVRDHVQIMACNNFCMLKIPEQPDELTPGQVRAIRNLVASATPGLTANRVTILDEAGRTSRYTEVELRGLDFSETPPDAAALSRTWRTRLDEARRVVMMLPAEHAGRAVLDRSGRLFRGGLDVLHEAVASDALLYHAGSIRGALPTPV